jgi:hypothetical protein
MCNEWLNSFEVFLSDMGQKPSPKHSIERKRVNEGYNKDNCFWATPHQQAANKRNSNKTVGIYFYENKNYWEAQLTVNNVLVLRKRFNTEAEAIAARKAAEIEYKIYK